MWLADSSPTWAQQGPADAQCSYTSQSVRICVGSRYCRWHPSVERLTAAVKNIVRQCNPDDSSPIDQSSSLPAGRYIDLEMAVGTRRHRMRMLIHRTASEQGAARNRL